MTDSEGRAAPLESRSILQDASRYTAATYAAQIGSFVVGLVTKGLLGPTNVGVWNLLNILLGYLAAVQVGTGDAVAKEVPYLRARGEEAEARRLGDAMFGFVLTASVVGGLVVGMVALWRWLHFGVVFAVGLLLVGALFPLWMWVNMQMVAFRAAKRFDILSTQLLLQLAVTAAIGLPLIWRLSIYGQYAAFFLATAVSFLYLRRAAATEPRTRYHPVLDRGATGRLLAIGIPLQLAGLVFTVQTTADSLTVAKELGVTMLGYYSLAVTVKAYVYQTPTAFAVVMFPRFQERFGLAKDDPVALRAYVEKPILAFAFVVLPVLIGGSWQVVPFLIRHFLPAFTPAIPAIKLLLVGTFFASLWQMPGQFLVAINRLWHYVGFAAAGAGLVALAVPVALRFRPDIGSAALATSIAYGLTFLLLAGYAVRHFRSIGGTVLFLAEVMLAGAALFGALVAVDAVLPSSADLVSDGARMSLRLLILLVAGLPLLWRADRALDLRTRLPWRRSRS